MVGTVLGEKSPHPPGASGASWGRLWRWRQRKDRSSVQIILYGLGAYKCGSGLMAATKQADDIMLLGQVIWRKPAVLRLAWLIWSVEILQMQWRVNVCVFRLVIQASTHLCGDELKPHLYLFFVLWPWPSHLSSSLREDSNAFLTELMWGLPEVIYVKP